MICITFLNYKTNKEIYLDLDLVTFERVSLEFRLTDKDIQSISKNLNTLKTYQSLRSK